MHPEERGRRSDTFRIVRGWTKLFVVLGAACIPGDLEGGGRLEDCRSPRLTPFAADSFWNTPMGSGAVSHDAKLEATRVGTIPIRILAPEAIDPEVEVFPNQPPDLCADAGFGSRRYPLPPDLEMGTLAGNGTVVVFRPGSDLHQELYQFHVCDKGVFGRFAENDEVSARDDLGDYGSIGGSFTSALGGTLRTFEVTDQVAIRHALKVGLPRSNLYRSVPGEDTRVWPANAADSCAPECYGGTDDALKMGALLLIPPSIDIASQSLKTELSLRVAYALQNFGAYVVNSSEVPALFVEHRAPIPDDFLEDVARLLPLLHVMENNRETMPGGGGELRAPKAAPFCTGQ
jgi:hypothetical protein